MTSNIVQFPAQSSDGPPPLHTIVDETITRLKANGDQRILPVVRAIKSGEISSDSGGFLPLPVDGLIVAVRCQGDEFEIRTEGIEFEAWGSLQDGFVIEAALGERHLFEAVITALQIMSLATNHVGEVPG